jgi:hypothetical protein
MVSVFLRFSFYESNLEIKMKIVLISFSQENEINVKLIIILLFNNDLVIILFSDKIITIFF